MHFLNSVSYFPGLQVRHILLCCALFQVEVMKQILLSQLKGKHFWPTLPVCLLLLFYYSSSNPDQWPHWKFLRHSHLTAKGKWNRYWKVSHAWLIMVLVSRAKLESRVSSCDNILWYDLGCSPRSCLAFLALVCLFKPPSTGSWWFYELFYICPLFHLLFKKAKIGFSCLELRSLNDKGINTTCMGHENNQWP